MSNYNLILVGLSGIGSMMESNDIKKGGAFSAAALRQNAMLARKQAEDAVKRGETNSMEAYSKGRSMLGSQRAAMAAQGIDINYGSAMDVQVDTSIATSMDMMMIRNNAAREAWGFNVQASDYENQAYLTEMSTKNKSRSTLITGGLNALRLYKS